MKKCNVSQFLYPFLLILAVALTWCTVGGFEYVRYDDNLYTWDYPNVASGLNWDGVKGVFANLTQGGIWMPLTSITYMLDITLWGAGPGPHHLASVFYHAVNAVLVYILILRLLKTDNGEELPNAAFAAFVGTALWALHPQRCESVSWIASRKDLVFTLFVLLGLHSWLSAAQSKFRLLLVYVFMALACMGKPTAMVFPVVAFCVRPDRDWKKYLPMFALTVAVAILTVHSQTHPTGDDTMFVRGMNEGYGSLAWRVLNAAVAVGLYFAQFVVPYGIHVCYRPHVGSIPEGAVIGLAVLVIACSVFAVCVWRGARAKKPIRTLLLSALWFLAAIGPTLGVAGGFGHHARADRFLYLPMIAVAWLLSRMLVRVKLNALAKCALGILSLAYAIATLENSNTYKSDFELFGRALKFDPDSVFAMTHVAAEYCAKLHDPDKGIELYRRAICLEPDNDEPRELLAFALATRGNPKDAGEVFNILAPLVERPELDLRGKATAALGAMSMLRHDWSNAIRFLKQALTGKDAKKLFDDTAMRLAMCYYNTKDYDSAKPLLQRLSISKRPEVAAKARELIYYIYQKEQPLIRAK